MRKREIRRRRRERKGEGGRKRGNEEGRKKEREKEEVVFIWKQKSIPHLPYKLAILNFNV